MKPPLLCSTPTLSRSSATTTWRTKASPGSPWPNRTTRTGMCSTSGPRATPRPFTWQHPWRPLSQAPRLCRSTTLRLYPQRICSAQVPTSSLSQPRSTISRSALQHTHTPSPHSRPRRTRLHRTGHHFFRLGPRPSTKGHSLPQPGSWPPPSPIWIARVPRSCCTLPPRGRTLCLTGHHPAPDSLVQANIYGSFPGADLPPGFHHP